MTKRFNNKPNYGAQALLGLIIMLVVALYYGIKHILNL